jgi:hypothetical protein
MLPLLIGLLHVPLSLAGTRDTTRKGVDSNICPERLHA